MDGREAWPLCPPETNCLTTHTELEGDESGDE